MIQFDMHDYFAYQYSDNPAQASIRSYYESLYFQVDGMHAPDRAAEKSVAKRKLLESMDAAIRALK